MVFHSMDVHKSKHRILYPCDTNGVKSGCDRSIIKGTYLENKVHSRPYLRFHWIDFLATLYFAIPTMLYKLYIVIAQ